MDADALIADLDGTIWDSRPWYTSLIARLSGREPREIRSLVESMPLPTVIDRLPEVSRARFQRAMADHIDSLRTYESVEATLSELQRSSVPIAAATSLPGWLAETMLALTGLESFFHAVSHASRPPRKPSPAVIARLLTELGLDTAASRALVVGDDQRDADLATNSGCDFAWASYGYGERPHAPKYSVLRRFSDLLHI